MVPVALALAAASLYLLTAAPSLYWLDSSEFVAAAWSLGVAHPPGHPLAALLGRLAAYLPVGTIAFRVNIASALQTAVAAGVVALISYQLLARLREPADSDHNVGPAGAVRWSEAVVIIATTLTAAGSYALWFQAIRAEVYALNLMLLVAVASALLRWDRDGDRRYLLLAGLLGGLGLCNHHLLVLLALPAVGVFVVTRRPRRAGTRRVIAGLAAATLLGLCTLTYLPLRARRSPMVNWGNATTVERFGWLVSARAFQKSVDRAARQTFQHRSLGAAYAVMGGPPTALGPMIVGAVVALLGIGGLYLGARRRRTRRAALLLGGLVLFNLAGPMLVGFDPFNPDAHGYLALAVALLAPGAALMLCAVVEAARRAGHPLTAGALAAATLLLPAAQLATNLPRADLRRHWATEETARRLLDQAPGALLVTSYFQSVFNSWAMQTAFDFRPDVQVVHRNFFRQPGYIDNLRQRMPNLQGTLLRWENSGDLQLADLDRSSEKRAVAVEYDLNIQPQLVRRLWPHGLTLMYRSDNLAPNPGGLHQLLVEHRKRILSWQAKMVPLDDLETHRALTWTQYVLARYACARSISAMARFHLDLATQLAPQSSDLARLRRQCLLER